MTGCETTHASPIQVKVVGSPAPPVPGGSVEPDHNVADESEGGARRASTAEPHGNEAQMHVAGMPLAF